MEQEISANLKQTEFINSTCKSVLVSASAGSGKTTTMIKKLIHLIVEKQIDVMQLLVLTFTDAAANEMKQKLYIALNKEITNATQKLYKLENGSVDYKATDKTIKLLINATQDLNFCDIGTFHSIFKRIITKYFYHLDLDPAFSMLDDQEQKILLNQAVSQDINDFIV